LKENKKVVEVWFDMSSLMRT